MPKSPQSTLSCLRMVAVAVFSPAFWFLLTCRYSLICLQACTCSLCASFPYTHNNTGHSLCWKVLIVTFISCIIFQVSLDWKCSRYGGGFIFDLLKKV